jgi:dTDP-glucose 4,6-dehydratase
MKVAVLGSNSFAGACFVNYALDRNCEVLGISRSPEPHPVYLPYRCNPARKRFLFRQLDLNDDIKEICDQLAAWQPDSVVDFAGQGMVAPSWQWPEQWYATNIVAKVKLHNFLKDQSWLKRYVRVSTPEVYGSIDGPVDETAPYNPSTPYAVSHAAIDLSLLAFWKQYDFPVVLTRFANFYGPGQQLYRIVPHAIISAKTGGKLQLHGGGTSVRAFVYGEDVAAATFLAMTKGRDGEIYHFSTSEFVSIRELVERIAAVLEVPFDHFVELAPERPGKDHAYRLDCRKARDELGWSAKYLLDQGLRQTIRWVENNLAEIRTLPLDYIHKP